MEISQNVTAQTYFKMMSTDGGYEQHVDVTNDTAKEGIAANAQTDSDHSADNDEYLERQRMVVSFGPSKRLPSR